MSFKSSKLKFFFRWLSQNLAFYHWQVLICTPLSHIEVMAAFFLAPSQFAAQKTTCNCCFTCKHKNVPTSYSFLASPNPANGAGQSLHLEVCIVHTPGAHARENHKNTTCKMTNERGQAKQIFFKPKLMFSWQKERLLDDCLFPICLHSLQMASFSEHRSASIHVTLHTCIFWARSNWSGRVIGWDAQHKASRKRGRCRKVRYATLCTASIIKAQQLLQSCRPLAVLRLCQDHCGHWDRIRLQHANTMRYFDHQSRINNTEHLNGSVDRKIMAARFQSESSHTSHTSHTSISRISFGVGTWRPQAKACWRSSWAGGQVEPNREIGD